MCKWSQRTGWSWSPGACKETFCLGRGNRPVTVCRSILFPAFAHKEDAATQAPKICEVCALLTTQPWSFLLLAPLWAPTKAGWIPGVPSPFHCLPLPLPQGKDSLIALCHGVFQPLNPCVATVCSLPQLPVATCLDVPLKDLTKRWENLRMIGNPPPGWGQGSVTPLGQWQPVPHNSVYPSCACALVLDCCCTSLPVSQSSQWRREVTFRNVCWEARARLYLGFGPCT